jgi:hypothetical protein
MRRAVRQSLTAVAVYVASVMARMTPPGLGCGGAARGGAGGGGGNDGWRCVAGGGRAAGRLQDWEERSGPVGAIVPCNKAPAQRTVDVVLLKAPDDHRGVLEEAEGVQQADEERARERRDGDDHGVGAVPRRRRGARRGVVVEGGRRRGRGKAGGGAAGAAARRRAQRGGRVRQARGYLGRDARRGDKSPAAAAAAIAAVVAVAAAAGWRQDVARVLKDCEARRWTAGAVRGRGPHLLDAHDTLTAVAQLRARHGVGGWDSCGPRCCLAGALAWAPQPPPDSSPMLRTLAALATSPPQRLAPLRGPPPTWKCTSGARARSGQGPYSSAHRSRGSRSDSSGSRPAVAADARAKPAARAAEGARPRQVATPAPPRAGAWGRRRGKGRHGRRAAAKRGGAQTGVLQPQRRPRAARAPAAPRRGLCRGARAAQGIPCGAHSPSGAARALQRPEGAGRAGQVRVRCERRGWVPYRVAPWRASFPA